MTTRALAAGEAELIFRWDAPRRRRRAFIMFLCGSIAFHAFCFYLFQIIYPPAVALLPPPGRIAMISPRSPDGQVLLRWVEAEDPALASMTQRPPDAKTFALPAVEHVPSYLTAQPALKEFPRLEQQPPAPLSSHPPAAIEPPRAQPAASPTVARTAVEFFGAVAGLGAVVSPEMQFSASGTQGPEAAEFRIAVDPAGAVRHCFLHRSSGVAALDREAIKYLLLCRFPPTQAPKSEIRNNLVWGGALVSWGTDITAPAATNMGKPAR